MKRLIHTLVATTLLLALVPAVAYAQTTDNLFKTDLIAGQTMDVGDVLVWNDGDNLYVRFVSDVSMIETHLHVAESLDGIPQANGNPIPGMFTYSEDHGCSKDYTYTIPLGDWTVDKQLIIAAHVSLGGPCINPNELTYEAETAWGAGVDFPGKNWATYFNYTVQCPGPTKIALIAKRAHPYFDAVNMGAQEAATELCDTVIFQVPDTPDAAGQIELAEALIAQKVDVIGFSANDREALVPVGREAMEAGIKVMSWDSEVAPEGRMIHENQNDSELVGRLQVQMLAEMIDYEGEVAILSASASATIQNTWIEWMNEELTDPKYANMKLVAIVYGDDDPDKSYDEARDLFDSYPNLKGIISPTVVGIAATGRALTDAGLCGKIALTGLGLPSQMSQYIKSGCCEAMALWNPIDMGYLTTYIAHYLADGTLTPMAGESLSAGRMGDFTVVEVAPGDLQVFQGPLLEFNADNIDEWADIF